MANYYIFKGKDKNSRESWQNTLWDELPVGFDFMTEEQYEDKFPPPIEVPQPRTPEELAALEQHQVQSEAAQLIQTAIQQQAVQTMSFAPTAFAILAKAGLFEEWQPGSEYAAGQRLVQLGVVYEVQQAVTAHAHQTPGSTGMLAVYRPLSIDADSGAQANGSLDHPIAFIHGMDVSSGLYYSYEGRIYLAKADLRPCVWNPGTAGVWQWEVLDA